MRFSEKDIMTGRDSIWPDCPIKEHRRPNVANDVAINHDIGASGREIQSFAKIAGIGIATKLKSTSSLFA